MGKKTENISIIDQGLCIDGVISCAGKLIIKGTVKGTLEGETVVIAEDGAVYASASGESVTIGGLFEGDIRASRELIILPTGNCSGRVVCRDLVVQAGGVLNAEVVCTAGRQPESEISAKVQIADFTT